MNERRRYIRFESDLTLRYVYIRGMITLEEDARLKDISINGMRLYLPPVIKKGDIFLVELNMPFTGLISAIAKVIWTRELPEAKEEAGPPSPAFGRQGEAGVEFDWISNIDKLGRYLQKLKLAA